MPILGFISFQESKHSVSTSTHWCSSDFAKIQLDTKLLGSEANQNMKLLKDVTWSNSHFYFLKCLYIFRILYQFVFDWVKYSWTKWYKVGFDWFCMIDKFILFILLIIVKLWAPTIVGLLHAFTLHLISMSIGLSLTQHSSLFIWAWDRHYGFPYM